MKIPQALGLGAIGLLDKNSSISKMFGLGGDDAAKAAEEEKKKKEQMAMETPSAGPMKPLGMKRGGKVKKMAKGGSASRRADGVAKRGHTIGKCV